jgi:hypothetical protein
VFASDNGCVKLPTPIGLLQEEGVTGEILRQLPRAALDEAETQNDPWTWLANWVQKNPVDHWCIGTPEMRDAECATLEEEEFKHTGIGVYEAAKERPDATVFQGVRKVRFNFHKDDPAKVIMHITMAGCWPDSFRKTFEAAASQRRAILRLVEVADGRGSISESWRLLMYDSQMRGDQTTADHWADKITARILQRDKGRQWLLKDKVEGLSAPLETREVAGAKYEKFYAADVSHLGRTKADKKWKSADGTRTPVTFKRDTIGQKIATPLALRWMAVEDTGFPGFAFISDKALATLLGLTLPFPGLLPQPDDSDNRHGQKMIEDCRLDIGLKKAETLVVGLKQVDARKWAILDEHSRVVGYFNQADSLPQKLAGCQQ